MKMTSGSANGSLVQGGVHFNPIMSGGNGTVSGSLESSKNIVLSPKKHSLVKKLQLAVQKKQQAVSGII